MAVTTIRKVSSYTLSALMLISLIIFALFFFGGTEQVTTTGTAEYLSYKLTDPLLFWSYILLAVAALAAVVFALKGFIDTFSRDSKAGMMSLAGVGAFAALLLITYFAGDSTPIAGLNAAAQKFNTPGWLQTTDMWLYSSYILLVLCVIAAVFGATKKVLNR